MDRNSLSRRSFVKVTSGMIGAGSVLALAGCGPAAQSSDNGSSSSTSTSGSSSAVLGDGTTLRVGMEAAYAPYNWQASEEADTTIPIENVDGSYADGYDVQVAKKIADGLGMDPVAVKMSFSGLVDCPHRRSDRHHLRRHVLHRRARPVHRLLRLLS